MHRLSRILAGGALFLLPGCVTDREPSGADIGAGDPLPRFSVTLNDGSLFSSESMRGKHGVILFFNTGCPDCRRELPEAQRAWEELRGRDDVAMACIARQEGADEIAAYWREHSLTIPWSPQPDRTVYSLFASGGIPRLYVVSPLGIVTHAWTDSDAPSAESILAAIP